MRRKRTISREPDNDNNNNNQRQQQQQQQQQQEEQVDIESGNSNNNIDTVNTTTTLLNSTAIAARTAAIKAANRNFGQNIDISHSPTEHCEEKENDDINDNNIHNDNMNTVNAISNQQANIIQTVTETTGQNQPNNKNSTQLPQQSPPPPSDQTQTQTQTQTQQETKQETKQVKKKSKQSRTSDEYNPRWKGYTYIMVLSLINLSAVSNVRDSIQSSAVMRNISDGYFEGRWGMHMVFGSATFAYSLLVLISDRLQIGIYIAKDESKQKKTKKDDETTDDNDDTEMISYTKLLNGQLEGYCLLFATVWWIIGVSFQTQVHGIAYLALNIYFSSWLSLVSCIYTLEQWSKSKDILSFVELTGLSETLRSWYILFISSLVVTGTSINMAVMPYMNEFSRETKTKDVGGPPIIIFDSIKITSPTALGIAFGIVSTITSAGFILVHYNLIEFCSEGGWIELAATVSLILLWVIGVSIITQNDSVGATIVGVPYQEIFTPLVNDTQRNSRSTLRELYRNKTSLSTIPSSVSINNMDPIFLGLTNYYLQTEIDTYNLKKSLYGSYNNVTSSSSSSTTTTTTLMPSISPSESTLFIALVASTDATTITTSNDTTRTIQMMNSSASSTLDYSRKQLFWNQSSSLSLFNNTLVPLPTLFPIRQNNTTTNTTNITSDVSSSPSLTPSDTPTDTPSDTPSSMPSLSPSTIPSITLASVSIQPSTILPTIFLNTTENDNSDGCVIIFKNMSFDCNKFIPGDYITRKVAIPGSNLYVFVWICLLSSINIALRWKAAQAIQFAKNAEEQQRKKEQQRQQQYNHHQRKKQQQQQQFAMTGTTNVVGGVGADNNDDTNFDTNDYEDDVEITFSSDNPTDIVNRRRNNSTSNPLSENNNNKNYTMNNNQFTFDDIDGMDDGYYSDEFIDCDEY